MIEETELERRLTELLSEKIDKIARDNAAFAERAMAQVVANQDTIAAGIVGLEARLALIEKRLQDPASEDRKVN